MAFADIDDVLRDGSPLLMVAEQDSFLASNGHIFCVLVPLMTNDGERFEEPVDSFPNRGRIWWLAGREGIDRRPRHGDIVTAAIDTTPNYDPTDPKKERYQIRRGSSRLGSIRWLQVIDFSGDGFTTSDLTAEEGIPWTFGTPTSRVLIRLKDAIVGPFNARYSEDANLLTLTAINLGKPTAWRLPVKRFNHEAQAERFADLTVFPNNDRIGAVPFPLEFVSERNAKLMEQGVLVDAASDKFVVKWALGLAQATNAQRQAFNDAWSRVADYTSNDEPEAAERLKRFHAICSNGERIAALGSEVATELANGELFRKLVEDHVEAITAKRIDEEVTRRKDSVEAAIKALETRRAALSVEYDEAKKRQEEELAREEKAWMDDLVRREKEIVLREEAVDAKEQSIAARLEKLIDTYHRESERVGNEVLTQLPILLRTGLGAQGSGVARDTTASNRPVAAAFLDRPVVRDEITEKQFLDQFRSVAEARGCVFSEDDLINFHVTVKTGTWSVLAGPSGTGKSSLPRLYAEALGMSNEFIEVAVRPDWLDDRDVVGAFNPLTGRFEPAATGLVDRLVTAFEDIEKERGGIYIICLDEMNLARVEHYFAQFLSILERPPAERVLSLFGQALERMGDPYARYRELRLRDNIRFVGTVNIDETTHFFSPKVLDRSAIVTLDEPDFSRQKSHVYKSRELAVRSVHLDVYRTWIRDHQDAPDAVRDLLLKIDARLRHLRAGLGFRLLNRILRYVASSTDLLPADDALDFALSQSVLPRLPTHHMEFAQEADALLGLLPPDRFARVAKMLGRMKEARGEHGFFQLV